MGNSQVIQKSSYPLLSMALLPNRQLVYADGAKLNIMDLNTNKVEGIFNLYRRGNFYAFVCCALLLDNKLAFGSDYVINLISLNDEYKVDSLYSCGSSIMSLLLLNNGNFVSGAAGEYDQIKIWDKSKNYKCICTLGEHNDGVTSLINLLNGYFASGSWDYTIKIWDQSYKLVSSQNNYSAVLSLLILLNNNIVCGLKNKTMKIWECHNNYKSLQCINVIHGHTGGIMALKLLRNEYLISGSEDATIKIWDIKCDFKCLNTLQGHKKAVTSIEVEDDMLLTASEDCDIRQWII
jgi:WD40 repeat protein